MWSKPHDRTPVVALIQPYYTYHLFQIEKAFGGGASIIYVDLAPNFEIDWHSLETVLHQQQVDVLLACNPSNPTGKLFSQEDINKLVATTGEHQTKLIVDECYCDMIWVENAHPSPIYINPLPEHVVVVRGFSKVLGCQSWRVGYLVSAPDTVTQLMRIHDPIYICTPWLQHSVGTYVSAHFEDFAKHKNEVNGLMRSNWKILSKAFHDALGWEPVEPEGTMYGLFRHPHATDSDACVQALEAGVGVCPGTIFWKGNPAHTGYTRIHCGVSAEKAQQVVANLQRFKQRTQ
eukprot:TRINITY_DN5218_c0_g1_i1.p1 TRINITY_DN5218_c0_g1~~TRINITY_DN5218_c0_g1_i1.p1  ORF type:complete len:290 (-),score=39.44 TRINITY_DN5218_c0_g1_i1:6-875(-)